MQKQIGFLFIMICTVLGADVTLFSPVSERGITARTLQLKDAMQERGTKDLQFVSMMNAEELSVRYNANEPYITFTIPQNGHDYRFKIDVVKEFDRQKLMLQATSENGVSKGRLTFSFSHETGIGTITVPEGTFSMYLYKDKGWIGEKYRKKIVDEKGIYPPDRKEKKIRSHSAAKEVNVSSLQKRILRTASPYEVSWMVYLSRKLANTFLSTDELELSLENFVAEINRIYSDSHINAVLKLVHYEIIDMDDPACSETVLDNMWGGKAPYFQNLDMLQHQYRADVVSVLVNDFNFWGGLGYMNSCYGYAMDGTCMWWEGPNYNTCMYDAETVAHEIGHNMGLAHSYAQGEEGTEFVFGRGHGVDNSFATVMAYADAYNVWSNVLLFSDPGNLQCNHLPCGVSHEYDDAADAVYAVNMVLPYFSAILSENDGTRLIDTIENETVRNCYLNSASVQSSEHNQYTVSYLSQLKNIECQGVDASDMNFSLSNVYFFTMSEGNISGSVYFDTMPKLSWLDLHDNRINTVDISNSYDIEGIFLSSNQITGMVDLSNQYGLKWLGVDNNLITHLILPQGRGIENLDISDNPLNILNIENLKNIGELYAYNTPLECWQEKVLLAENNISHISAFCKENAADNFDTDGDGIANIDDMDDDGDGLHDLEDNDIDGDGVDNRYDQFVVDQTRSGDFDGDGLMNEVDSDDDNDGVEDSLDPFPFDATESRDSDGDGIGDNSDSDADGDGRNDALALRIEALYVAFYHRAGDLEGLDYWYGQIARGDKTLADLSEGFASHPKFAEEYDGLDNVDFVTKIYINMLGNAPDEGGLHYWVSLLDKGMSKSDFIASFISAVFDTDLESMLENAQLTQQEYDDALKRKNILQNKSTVSIAFVNHLNTATNVTMPNDLDHDDAYLASIKIISEVTEEEASKICAIDFLDIYANANGSVGIDNINSMDIVAGCH